MEGIGYDATLDEDSEDDSGDDPAAADRRFWRRKFCWSVVFTVPVFLLGMVPQHLAPSHTLLNSPASQELLFIPVAPTLGRSDARAWP